MSELKALYEETKKSDPKLAGRIEGYYGTKLSIAVAGTMTPIPVGGIMAQVLKNSNTARTVAQKTAALKRIGNNQAQPKTVAANQAILNKRVFPTPAEMEPESTIQSQKPSGKQEYYNFNQMSQKQISKLESEVRQRSPIKVPNNANASIQHKTAQKGSGGYEQIKYTWVDQGVKYESRWHTRTPEAPPTQGNSWVVTRQVQGSRTKRAGEKQYLMNNGTWIS